MEKQNIEQQIRDFLYDESMKSVFENLSSQDSLLELGIIDSVKMLDLIAYIEQQFGIQVDDEDLIPENFDNLEAITNYILARKNSSPVED